MASNPKWRDLPPELLLKIATSGDGIQNMMRGSCKTWKTGLEASCTQLTIIDSALPQDLGARFTALSKLDLQCCDPAPTPQSLHALHALPSLTSLSLKFGSEELTLELLGSLRGLPIAILALELGVGEVRDACMDALRSLNLARLDFSLLHRGRESFGDSHLRRLAGLPITQLDISRTAVSDAGMPALRDLPLLNFLDFTVGAGPASLTDAGLAELRGLPLTSLKIGDQVRITDEGIEALRNMPLVTLDLMGCFKISGACLEVFVGMPLSSLDLSHCDKILDLSLLQGLPLTCLNLGGLSGGVLNESFRVVRDMPLADLTLYSGVTDEALGNLRGKPLTRLEFEDEGRLSLEGLEVLRGMPLTDLSAGAIGHVRGEVIRGAPLTRLDVWGFTDSDLDALRGMELVELELWGCQAVTDRGLEALRGMPLTKLRISRGHNLTDAGIEVLRGMALEGLWMHSCPNITDSGLEVMLGMPFQSLHFYSCPSISEQGARRVAGAAAEVSFH